MRGIQWILLSFFWGTSPLWAGPTQNYSPETLAAAATQRFDGAPARLTANSKGVVARDEINLKEAQRQETPQPEKKPNKKTLKKPLPPGVKPIVSTMESKMGFGIAFLAIESIPMLIMQTPYIGKILGWPLYAILFPVAVVVGAIGALIGLFF